MSSSAVMSAGPGTPASASLYSYSTNTSSSTIAAQQRLASTSRHSPQASLPVNASTNILERPLNRTRTSEVSLAAWAFMLAEIISYSQSRVDSVNDLEKRLSALGYEAGQRILSLLLVRQAQGNNMKDPRREHRLIPILQFVHTQVYRYCFGRPADGLERSVEGEDEYMITMNQPPLTQYISVPKDMGGLSCEAFTAGIVEGVLDGLDVPARVTAHTVATDQYPQRTVILVKLDQRVMDREATLGK
ncbi:hypothetical protein CcaverHIS002_0601290 [Cutaneotrichosporon cavernicola]|uniref:Trafficking protein particle complex subunit n=1 Tax=Cutaneotrichosporon cavernicola TaxID=279322 RepID=A0AA48L5W6_9TREE|nr:uncharacterized protein CcaverHIS019_0501380 [Cutaneotrichosporon cavernicola]BEI85842.1 hypothetical protein CcaverHIS002_0601290 [Cutaneotrichosporon cavernicola]BEI92510.1 hypothetical protein CcaverHIS019_0501380 [Cutaneotrichosporon cavernicola]BEJ00283.1 hypothetical protein CcaverHIS631_0501400 [Cutaneotrichosporon cavernicola]BEJ08053.1 hypothetical protein CcaverHIS641_0501380 [Cutaneotrichosporon cavernicola]